MRPSAQPFLWKRVLFAWEWEPSPYQRLSAPPVWRSIRMFKPSSRYCFPLILNVWKQDEANPVFDLIGCLPHWCRWKKFSFWPYYISFINHAGSIKMVAYWPRFFLRFDWPWLRLGPTLCARGFSSAVSGFGQVLNSDPLEKHALLTSVMAGYLPIFFFFFLRFRGPRHPGYQRYILACDYELRRPQAEDTSGEAARKNLWHPGYLGLWKRKK